MFVTFQTDGGSIRWSARLAETLASEAQAGYRTKPWGGVEVGGLLTGEIEDETITVLDRVVVDCDHEFGPAFELGAADRDRLAKTVAEVQAIEPKQGIVGWYRTTSKYLSMTPADTALADQFFSRAGHLTAIIQRGRNQQPLFGIFQRSGDGWRYAAGLNAAQITIEQETARQKSGLDDPATAAAASIPANSVTLAVESEEARPATIDNEDQFQTTSVIVDAPAAVFDCEAQPEPDQMILPLSVEPDYTRNAIGLNAGSTPPEVSGHVGHFGLIDDPFSLTPDPRYWYASSTHREAAAALLYGIQMRKATMVLIGEPGMGKTMVIEYVTDALKADGIEFAFVMNSSLTVDQFFELIAIDLQLVCKNYRKVEVLFALQDRLIAAKERGSTVAILIDDAHKLSTQLLDEIDLLGNLESRRGKLLQVVLGAQPAFDKKLEKAGLRSLRQRIALRAKLEPLSAAETRAYVQSRLKQAGAAELDVFPSNVLDAICHKVSGIPRVINMVCSALLERSFTQGRNVTTGLVEEIVRDLQLK